MSSYYAYKLKRWIDKELLKGKEGLASMAKFESGAVRSDDASEVRFDLIFKSRGLKCVAEAFAEGSKKYGDDNWLKGIPISDLLNHALRHIYLWQQGDRSEDHLGHAAWNVMNAAHFASDEKKPKLLTQEEKDLFFNNYKQKQKAEQDKICTPGRPIDLKSEEPLIPGSRPLYLQIAEHFSKSDAPPIELNWNSYMFQQQETDKYLLSKEGMLTTKVDYENKKIIVERL